MYMTAGMVTRAETVFNSNNENCTYTAISTLADYLVKRKW